MGITVRFKYKVPADMPDGVAEVRMRNTDSGEDILKRFPISLKAGEHEAWAAWGGEGPDTSATNQEAVAALNNGAMFGTFGLIFVINGKRVAARHADTTCRSRFTSVPN